MSDYEGWHDVISYDYETRYGNPYKKEKKVITNEQLKDNKFYIGSNSIFTRGSGGWGHKTLDEAVAHAQQMLTDKKEADTVFIVEIVKVVRRKPIDVNIEDV